MNLITIFEKIKDDSPLYIEHIIPLKQITESSI
jgi:hypothetical protein